MNKTQLALNQFSKRFDGDMDALVMPTNNENVLSPQGSPQSQKKKNHSQMRVVQEEENS